MPFEIREGSGSIFKNEDKKSDNSPDYTGTIKVEGTLYSVALWDKVGKTGTQYHSVKVSVKENKPNY